MYYATFGTTVVQFTKGSVSLGVFGDYDTLTGQNTLNSGAVVTGN